MTALDLLILIITMITLALTISIIVRAEQNYRGLAVLPDVVISGTSTPDVAIIVPARDESDVIERLLSSLAVLDYPNFSVMVVDDSSTDDTACKAHAAGVEVLTLSGDPPPGWTGKCSACDQAVKRTTYEWLLFTDADTYHDANSLRRVMAYAMCHHLDAVSLLLRQECGTFWEKVFLPLAYQNYFSTLKPQTPAFNGQYILIKRSVYQQSGGFGAVRGRVMEDVALAAHLAGQGYAIELLNGHDAASVRMYRDLHDLWEGMIKTAFTAARDRGTAGFLLGFFVFFGMTSLLILLLGLLANSTSAILAGLLTFIVIGVGLFPWIRRFEVPGFYALFNPMGILLLFGIGVVSTFRTISGIGVYWKGRIIHELR